ncbi:MAG: ATP-binding protein [Candidatus Methanoplasma sp.]|jgi:predicted AAA+ superfamily ATPase|nr:ATP-binding protein [Candidatus Methanoplasma sp.]
MLKELKREMYLEKIRPFYHMDLIKAVTGVRRCGKSVLLRQIMAELEESGVEGDRIIYMNFESMEHAGVKTAEDLYAAINPKLSREPVMYLFFDEIQQVRDFERAINSFRSEWGCSIFITGSNGRLLSGELATLLTGRFVEFRAMPFTYREVVEYKGLNGIPLSERELEEYVRRGGSPVRLQLPSEESARAVAQDLYGSIIAKDILTRFKVPDADLMNRILDFLIDNSGDLFSSNSVKKHMASEGRPASPEKVMNYVGYAVASMIVSKVRRYDLSGKRFLKTLEKYYVADTGMMFARREGQAIDWGSCIETVVHNELAARGYGVSIGATGTGEIDFIAVKKGRSDPIYIQACYLLSDERVVEREFGPLLGLRDNHPKYVISMDRVDMSRDGVRHLRLVEDFLMSDEDL